MASPAPNNACSLDGVQYPDPEMTQVVRGLPVEEAPEKNEAFPSDGVTFPEPVKPQVTQQAVQQVRQTPGTSCCVGRRKCILATSAVATILVIGLVVAGFVLGFPFASSERGSQKRSHRSRTPSVMGFLSLSVDDPVSFLGDERVKPSLAAAIASPLQNVSAETVNIDSIVLEAGRRLAVVSSLRGARRLQVASGVKVAYSIPFEKVDAMKDAAASLKALKPEVLTSSIMEELQSAGLEHNVTVTSLKVKFAFKDCNKDKKRAGGKKEGEGQKPERGDHGRDQKPDSRHGDY